MRPSRRNATDASQGPIVAAMRRAGATVEVIGHPLDLLVGYLGVTELAECKLPLGPRGGESHTRFTPDQQDFIGRWRGSHWVLRTPEDGIALLADMRRRREAIVASQAREEST